MIEMSLKFHIIIIVCGTTLLYILNVLSVKDIELKPKIRAEKMAVDNAEIMVSRASRKVDASVALEQQKRSSNNNRDVTANSNKFLKETDHWQIIRRGKKQFAVFSGYYDETDINHPKVRVTGAGYKTVTSENNTFCLLYFHKNSSNNENISKYDVRKVAAKVINTFEWRNKFPFAGRIVECKMVERGQPDEVAVFLEPKSKAYKIKVHPFAVPERKGRMCGCLKHLFNFSNYKQLLDLMEYIEFYKIMGVDHFYIYVLSVSEWMRHVLLKYEDRGDVTLVYLDIPPHVLIEEEYQFILNTDCMLRSRAGCEYTLTCDSDEFLLPKKYADLKGLVKGEDKPHIGSFCFTNAYFDPELPDDMENDNPYKQTTMHTSFASGFPVRLRTLLKVYRGVPKKYKVDRCKCISKSALVDEMGIHAVRFFISPEIKSKFFVDNVGLMHHYRRKDWVDFPFPNSTETAHRDTSMHRIGKQLLRRVMNTIREFQL